MGKYIYGDYSISVLSNRKINAIVFRVSGSLGASFHSNAEVINYNEYVFSCFNIDPKVSQYIKMFLNGVELTEYTTNTSLGSDQSCNSTHGLYIGNDLGTRMHFKGKIDDVRLYNRALSTSEISQIYNATKSRY